MTVVPATSFYEWPFNNDTATCEECGKEMEVPATDDLDRDMKEPFWIKEDVRTYIGGNYDKFHSFCEKHYEKRVQKVMDGQEVFSEQ